MRCWSTDMDSYCGIALCCKLPANSAWSLAICVPISLAIIRSPAFCCCWWCIFFPWVMCMCLCLWEAFCCTSCPITQYKKPMNGTSENIIGNGWKTKEPLIHSFQSSVSVPTVVHSEQGLPSQKCCDNHVPQFLDILPNHRTLLGLCCLIRTSQQNSPEYAVLYLITEWGTLKTVLRSF